MILDSFNLEGKTALVTGCSKGIGKAIAIGLAEAGANIIGVSSSLQSGGETGRAVEALGRTFSAYQADFSNRAALYAFIEEVKRDFPIIDILVNNAGTILREPVASHSDDYWDTVIEVNQSSPFILTRELGAEMLKRKSGKIIFIASLLSFQGGILVPGYAASKGAIRQLTMAFANEWASHGINVNAIAPGYISTDNTAALRGDSERSSSILARIPANRWGEPDDFKGPAVFLASKAADYMHGSVLLVDGGWMGR